MNTVFPVTWDVKEVDSVEQHDQYFLSRPRQPTTTTMMPDMVSRDAYEQLEQSRTDYQIATGVLGGLLGCGIVLFVIVYIRKRKKASAIV